MTDKKPPVMDKWKCPKRMNRIAQGSAVGLRVCSLCLVPCAIYNDNQCCQECIEPCRDMLECRMKEGRCRMEMIDDAVA